MLNRKTLLHKLLIPLLQEWGHKEVESAIAYLSRKGTWSGAYAPEISRSTKAQKTKSTSRLLASEQVERANLLEGQEGPLRELAIRFDSKEFLPSISDAREFLILMGKRPGAMKDRSDAFRQLLDALSGLPAERLEHVAHGARHSGPSQLGPLSDAISAAAATLPRHREPNAS